MKRTAALALACLALWNGAFTLSSRFGVWLPVCTAAVLLGMLSLWLVPGLRLGFVRPSALALGLLAGLVQIAATLLLYGPASRGIPGLTDEVSALYRLMGCTRPWQTLVALPVIVLGEELIFRGGLFALFEDRLGRWLAAPAAALVYCLAHVASLNGALIGAAFACGLYWGLVRAQARSLWAPLICHLLWDWTFLAAMPLGA